MAHVSVTPIILIMIAIAFILGSHLVLLVKHIAHTMSLLTPCNVLFGLGDNLVENV